MSCKKRLIFFVTPCIEVNIFCDTLYISSINIWANQIQSIPYWLVCEYIPGGGTSEHCCILQTCLSSGLSSCVHALLGSKFSFRHLASLVLCPPPQVLEHWNLKKGILVTHDYSCLVDLNSIATTFLNIEYQLLRLKAIRVSSIWTSSIIFNYNTKHMWCDQRNKSYRVSQNKVPPNVWFFSGKSG